VPTFTGQYAVKILTNISEEKYKQQESRLWIVFEAACLCCVFFYDKVLQTSRHPSRFARMFKIKTIED